MRIHAAAGVAFALIVSACTGDTAATTTTAPGSTTTTTVAGETTTTTAPGFTVTSDDGAVVLEVPTEAMASDPGISITVLPPEEYPPELEGAAHNPNTRIYRLLPDALVFDAPARITRTIDVSNFGDLEEHEVPLVVLLVRTPDGTYEVLDDLHVMRRDDRVEVSADLTHFSTMVTVSEQQSMQLVPDAEHSGFATEEGTDLFLQALFFAPLDSPATAPGGMVGWGRTRSDTVEVHQENLAVACVRFGSANPRLGYRFDLRADAGEGQAGLRTTPLLVPGVESVPMLVKSVVPFTCLDPATSLLGLEVSLTLQTDHPGGSVHIPGEDFRGGLSGALGSISWSPDPGRSASIGYVGLICDINRNGMLDAGDVVYQPFEVDYAAPGMGEFVLPLFGHADYFVYVLGGSSFSDVIMTDGLGMPLLDAFDAYRGLYQGTGRFETGFGLIGLDGSPAVYRVGPAETALESDEGALRVAQAWLRSFYP